MGTGAAALVAAALAVVVVTRLWTVLVHLVWRPYAVVPCLRGQQQGDSGDAGGDTLDLTSHDYIPRVDVALRYASGQDQF